MPNQLTPERFAGYPPEARAIAAAHVVLFSQLPTAFLPLLLRELIAYDWKFPAERVDLDNQLAYLDKLSPEALRATMAPFAALRLSPALEAVDWVNKPALFSENLTAHLWATHQIDAFRTAAVEYMPKVNEASTKKPLPVSRLAIVTIGRGVVGNRYPLFRKLRPHGVYYRNVQAASGVQVLGEAVAARAAAHPVPFGHWYIDGATTEKQFASGLTCVSYDALDPVRAKLVDKMRAVMQPGGGGPEVLRTLLAQMTPQDLGMNGSGSDGVLNHFQISILTEGSGTQLFSTTFVQWSAREVLRRAQPLTLFARFAPRQHEESMHELLAGSHQKPVPDPQGSLIDADIGAYYTWVNQNRLAEAGQSSFLAWFENGSEALAIGPSLPRGVEEKSAIDLSQIVAKVTA